MDVGVVEVESFSHLAKAFTAETLLSLVHLTIWDILFRLLGRLDLAGSLFLEAVRDDSQLLIDGGKTVTNTVA